MVGWWADGDDDSSCDVIQHRAALYTTNSTVHPPRVALFSRLHLHRRDRVQQLMTHAETDSAAEIQC
jgi:hypothetical protein